MQLAGGPKIDMKYGRVDGTEDQIGDTAGLPAGNAPFPQDDTPQGHLRAVFGRMGFTDQEIVALSGAHTLGRAYKERSGACRALPCQHLPLFGLPRADDIVRRAVQQIAQCASLRQCVICTAI